MSKLKTEQVLEVMLRARLQYEGYDAEGVEKKIAEVLAFPESFPDTDGYGFTYENYWDEAAMILDWIEEYEPEARAVAALLLSTPFEPKFNDGLIEDALADRRFHIGDRVVLIAVPTGLLTDLPEEDIAAISAVVGKPIIFSGYSGGTSVTLEWQDDAGDYHSIWVDERYVRATP